MILAECAVFQLISSSPDGDRPEGEIIYLEGKGRVAAADCVLHITQGAGKDRHDVFARLTCGVGLDPEPLMATAKNSAVKVIYEANTKEAITRSIFGAPTYAVDGDLFYGQDHLELVERALRKPFA